MSNSLFENTLSSFPSTSASNAVVPITLYIAPIMLGSYKIACFPMTALSVIEAIKSFEFNTIKLKALGAVESAGKG